MIFSISAILLVAIVAYFHYTQGFFSATLSAILAALAAVYAVAYHETFVSLLLRGRAAGYMLSMALVVLFCVFYLVPRTVFDRFIPGNVRVPVALDKIGAGLMGLVAGVFATGVLAVAAQTLPYGPSIAGYSRFPIADHLNLIIARPSQQSLDVTIPDELVSPRLESDKANSLILPVDDWLMAAVAHLSEGGSLAGAVPINASQPNYLNALFAQRLGIQLGGKITAMNLNGKTEVTVPKGGTAAEASFPQVESVLRGIRSPEKLPKTFAAGPGNVLLVVRTMFDLQTADPDYFVRLSASSARVVAGGENYYALGSLQDARVFVRNDADDPLFLLMTSNGGGTAQQRGIDLVFEVPKGALLAGGTGNKIADGVFIEVKRWARVDLSGRPLLGQLSPSPDVQVLRSLDTVKAIAALNGTPATPAK